MVMLLDHSSSGSRIKDTHELLLSQVKLLITNNAFCIVQRATAQSKTGIFRDYGVAEAPPGFQATSCISYDIVPNRRTEAQNVP
jgi:hypothetical protein